MNIQLWLNDHADEAWNAICVAFPGSPEAERRQIFADAVAAFEVQAADLDPREWEQLLLRITGHRLVMHHMDQPEWSRTVSGLQSTAWRVLGGERDRSAVAEDVVADVLERIVDRQLGPTQVSSFGSIVSWLRRAVARGAVDERRRAHGTGQTRYYQETLDPVVHYDLQDGATLAPEAYAEHGEQVAALARALATLPDDLRQTVVLRFWQELTYQQIGEALGVTDEAIKKRLRRALRRLRGRLTEPELG